jgi:hypothetical protein
MAAEQPGFFQRVGKFAKKQLASMNVNSRKRELKLAEAKILPLLRELYFREYPVNRFFAPVGTVIDEIQKYLGSMEMRRWRQHDPEMSRDGTRAEYNLTYAYRETFRIGALGDRLVPLTVAARIKAGILAGDGRIEPVTVEYEVLFRITVDAIAGHGVDVSARTTEMIDPENQCIQVSSGDFGAPSLMFEKLGSDPAVILMGRLHANVHQDGRPALDSWVADESNYSEQPQYRAACENIRLAREKVAEAEAALTAFG